MAEWRKIPDLRIPEDYEVSNTGQVRSLKRSRVHILAPQKTGGTLKPHRKHLTVGLCIEGRAKTFQVHRLVALAFIGPPPSAEHEVNHKNGQADDNRAENLEYLLPSENRAHARRCQLAARGKRHGRYTKPEATPRGSRHWAASITEDDVRTMRARRAAGERVKDIAADYPIHRASVSAILNGHRWKHVV